MLRFQHQSQCWAFYKQHIVHRTLLNQTKSLRMQHSVWKWQFEAKQAFVCKRSISIYLFYFIWSALVHGKAQRKLHTKINMKLQVGEVGSCTNENFNTCSPQMQRASWLSWGTLVTRSVWVVHKLLLESWPTSRTQLEKVACGRGVQCSSGGHGSREGRQQAPLCQ